MAPDYSDGIAPNQNRQTGHDETACFDLASAAFNPQTFILSNAKTVRNMYELRLTGRLLVYLTKLKSWVFNRRPAEDYYRFPFILFCSKECSITTDDATRRPGVLYKHWDQQVCIFELHQIHQLSSFTGLYPVSSTDGLFLSLDLVFFVYLEHSLDRLRMGYCGGCVIPLALPAFLEEFGWDGWMVTVGMNNYDVYVLGCF